MSTIKLEIPSDSPAAIGAAAMFFAYLCDGSSMASVVPPAAKDKPEPAHVAEDKPAPVAEDKPAPVAEDKPAPVAEDKPAPAPADEYPTDRGDGAMVDAEGRIWDKRIDSSNQKCVKASGLWMRRKNLDDDEYDRIKAEVMTLSQGGTTLVHADDAPVANNDVVKGAFNPQQQTPAQDAAPLTAADYYRKVMTGGFSTAQQAQVAQEFGLANLAAAVAQEQAMPGIMQQVVNRLEAL